VKFSTNLPYSIAKGEWVANSQKHEIKDFSDLGQWSISLGRARMAKKLKETVSMVWVLDTQPVRPPVAIAYAEQTFFVSIS
jgi:hypothetical protein